MDNTQQDLQIPEEIRNYLDGILTDANMNMMEDDMREEMIRELFARLDNFMTATIVDNLSQEDAETFVKMNEDKKPKEEIEAFVKEKMPNSEEVFTNAFANFRDLYLGNVTESRMNSAQDNQEPENTAPTE